MENKNQRRFLESPLELELHNGHSVILHCDPRVNIFVGANGSGKTLTLLAIEEHCQENEISVALYPEGYRESQERDCYYEVAPYSSKMLSLYSVGYGIKRYFSKGEKRIISLLSFVQYHRDCAVILIDDVEVYLHLHWQKELIDAFRALAPNAQLFLATHSPGIIRKGWFDKVIDIGDFIKKN